MTTYTGWDAIPVLYKSPGRQNLIPAQQVLESDLVRSAIHEAAHAVIAHLRGIKVVSVSTYPGEGFEMGSVSAVFKRDEFATEQNVVDELCVLLAPEEFFLNLFYFSPREESLTPYEDGLKRTEDEARVLEGCSDDRRQVDAYENTACYDIAVKQYEHAKFRDDVFERCLKKAKTDVKIYWFDGIVPTLAVHALAQKLMQCRILTGDETRVFLIDFFKTHRQAELTERRRRYPKQILEVEARPEGSLRAFRPAR